MLREEIEGLQANASAASRRSAQLSSQLANLQGSLETRLIALSAAFDAYVELGDVREQLAGFPDTSAVRRDAVAAIETLSRGGRPEVVADRGQDYWLSYAVNAVRALAAGSPDLEAERRAVELSPDAELFIVAAAGGLGHGARVGDRVAPLLTCDGSLNWRQVKLWRALLAGAYGEVLPAVRPVWVPAIDQTADTWVAWVLTQVGNSANAALGWLDALTAGSNERAAVELGPPLAAEVLRLAGDAPPAPADAENPQAGLRSVVIDLIGRGMGNEAELLERSRVLRARIEAPNGAAEDVVPEPPLRLVTVEVQEALLASPPASPRQRALLGWVAPGLRAAVAVFDSRAAAVAPAPVSVNTEAGSLDVLPTGADSAAVARRKQTLAQRNASPAVRIIAPAALTTVFAVLAVITLVAGSTRGSIALWLAAAVAGGALLYMIRDRRLAARHLSEQLVTLKQQITDGQQQARVDQAERERAADAAGRQASAITARLVS